MLKLSRYYQRLLYDIQRYMWLIWRWCLVMWWWVYWEMLSSVVLSLPLSGLIIICLDTMQAPFPPPQDRVNIDHMESGSLNWDADIEKNELMLDVVKQPIKHFYILKEFDKNVWLMLGFMTQHDLAAFNWPWILYCQFDTLHITLNWIMCDITL